MTHEAPRSQPNGEPGYPWGPFLREIDEKLTEAIQLPCLGGFVVTQYYGQGRETSSAGSRERLELCLQILDSGLSFGNIG
jgi:hypothetical protein